MICCYPDYYDKYNPILDISTLGLKDTLKTFEHKIWRQIGKSNFLGSNFRKISLRIN